MRGVFFAIKFGEDVLGRKKAGSCEPAGWITNRGTLQSLTQSSLLQRSEDLLCQYRYP